ncbi:MAG TPA: trypsin-like peptidase domain-containing protein [Bryobacteraceae bacterium]|jgi:serine protease Do|nr:trypsin-like peptidase domain-containing protein [Bryobacteraceae bacterium]
MGRRFAAAVFKFGVAAVLIINGQAQTSVPSLHDLSTSLESLSERVRQSVVQVFSIGYAPVDDTDASASNSSVVSKQRSTGSGVVLSPDGYIITNAHVVQGSKRVQVKLPPAGIRGVVEKINAKIIGLDHDTDLALLKVDRSGMQPLTFGNSDELRQGQLVLAFGNPFGLEGSASMGIVSSTSRQIRDDDSIAYIQTDAPINPGNSGGPLVDDSGRLVGVNTFILSQSGGSEGIGFAIPSNLVQAIFTQLRKDGHVHRGQIGIYGQTVTPALAAGLGLPRNSGVVVSDVEPESPADEAGVAIGDMILAVDGHPLEDMRQLDLAIFRHSVNDLVHLQILRDKQKADISLRIRERDNDPERFADMATSEDNLIPSLGILGVTIDKKLAQLLPDLRTPSGVVVAALSPDASDNGTGLEAGDVIHAMNGKPIDGMESLREKLKEFSSGDSVVLQIERDDRFMFLTVELE